MCPSRLLSGPLAAVACLVLAGCNEPELDLEPEPEQLPAAAKKFMKEPRPPQPEAKSPVTPLPDAVPSKPRPPFELPAELAETLHGIEWEVLDAPPAAELAWKVPDECKLEYTDLGTLSLAEEGFSVKYSYFQSFVLEKGGAQKMLRRPGRRLEYLKANAYGKSLDGFLDPSAHKLQPVPLTVSAERVDMPSVLSPLFQMQKGAAHQQTSPMHVWPPIPKAGEQAEWSYSLLFDNPDTLRKQSPSKVQLHGWVRLGFQRAAYLTATWPETGVQVPIGTDLSHLRVQNKLPRKSTLAQAREIVGHYLVSEHGYLALAHLEGMARVRNTFDLKSPRTGKAEAREVTEERAFSFTTKLLTDCSGSLFAKAESKVLPEDQTVELFERFVSQVAADRLTDAAELLSPAIRYAFPGDTPLYLLRGHFQSVGAESFGRKAPKAAGRKGVDFVGATKKGKKAYTTVVAEEIGGRQYLSFIGSSSRPDRKSWDLLVVQPGNVFSGTIKLFKPSF